MRPRWAAVVNARSTRRERTGIGRRRPRTPQRRAFVGGVTSGGTLTPDVPIDGHAPTRHHPAWTARDGCTAITAWIGEWRERPRGGSGARPLDGRGVYRTLSGRASDRYHPPDSPTVDSGHRRGRVARGWAVCRNSARFVRDAHGAGAEIRTRTPLRAAEFKSAASAVPPLRRRDTVAAGDRRIARLDRNRPPRLGVRPFERRGRRRSPPRFAPWPRECRRHR